MIFSLAIGGGSGDANESYIMVTPPLKVKGDQSFKEPQRISSPLGAMGPDSKFLLRTRTVVTNRKIGPMFWHSAWHKN
jgi:hypothetical protein